MRWQVLIGGLRKYASARPSTPRGAPGVEWAVNSKPWQLPAVLASALAFAAPSPTVHCMSTGLGTHLSCVISTLAHWTCVSMELPVLILRSHHRTVGRHNSLLALMLELAHLSIPAQVLPHVPYVSCSRPKFIRLPAFQPCFLRRALGASRIQPLMSTMEWTFEFPHLGASLNSPRPSPSRNANRGPEWQPS